MFEKIKELRAKAELDLVYAKAKIDFAYELISMMSAEAEAEVEETEAVEEETADTDFGNI